MMMSMKMINYYFNTSKLGNLTSNNLQDTFIDSYFSSNSSLTDTVSSLTSKIAVIDDKQPFTILLSLAVNSTAFVLIQTIALVALVIILAAFGTSLRIREMYVKALLKIFEYATNIKKEKLRVCEELLPIETRNEIHRRREIARLERLRKESFVLHPDEDGLIDMDENDNLKNYKNYNQQQQQQQQQQQTFLDKVRNKMGFSSTQQTNEDETFIDENHKNVEDDENKNVVKSRSYSDIKKNFQLGDIIEFVHKGIDTIIDDDVTKRFTTEELAIWNLLTRTNQQYEYVSFRVTILWLLGFILRYCVLFPFRLLLFFFACSYTLLSTYLIGLLPDGRIKRWCNRNGMQVLHRILSRVFSAIIRIHNREYRAQPGSICVANHTSPIDVIILSTDNTYSLIGQKHGGFTGMMQTAFSRASNHIWFDRTEAKDRSLVSKRMREHTQSKDNCPILIFPEGTCINNTSVMMFKKGCFEIGSTIYPVAIKYDSRFGDAFWNSQKHTMLQYLILMMTSWAIVVDVYYLPPMERLPNEDVMQFTNRVKAEIVKKGSFADCNWDGMLKRDKPKLDLMFKQQKQYVSQLKLD